MINNIIIYGLGILSMLLITHEEYILLIVLILGLSSMMYLEKKEKDMITSHLQSTDKQIDHLINKMKRELD